MSDPDTGHPSGGDGHDKGHASGGDGHTMAHLLHGIQSYRQIILVFLLLSFGGGALTFVNMRVPQAWRYVMCHLRVTSPVKPNFLLAIVVAHFDDDDGGQTKHVLDALTRSLSLPGANDVQVIPACDEEDGRSMLEYSGAHLLIWGEVIDKNVSLKMNLLPRPTEDSKLISKVYLWTERLEFEDVLKNDLGIQIAKLIGSMAEPSMLKRPTLTGSGFGDGHQQIDIRFYERLKRVAQLELLGKGDQMCRMKLTLGYVASILGDGRAHEARAQLDQLKGLPDCLKDQEFKALVHHHLGDVLMYLAVREKKPRLYADAAGAYREAVANKSRLDEHPLRWAISHHGLGAAYLGSAEHENNPKKTIEWAQQARAAFEEALHVFRTLRNERANETKLAIERTDDLVKLALEQQNATIGKAEPATPTPVEKSEPTIVSGSVQQKGPLGKPLSLPPPPRGKLKQGGNVRIGTLICDVWPEKKSNLKCRFNRLKTEKSGRLIGSIMDPSWPVETNKGRRLSWSVYAGQGDRYSGLAGLYRTQITQSGGFVLSNADKGVILHPEYDDDLGIVQTVEFAVGH